MTNQANKLNPGASDPPLAAGVAAAGDDLAQVETAIDDAQRAAGAMARGIEESAQGTMSEIVAAIELVESTGKPATLQHYDQAIAKAVDDMLEGDFVSVDLVLEGMHESTPPPVPMKSVSEPPATAPAATAAPPSENAIRSEDASVVPSAAAAPSIETLATPSALKSETPTASSAPAPALSASAPAKPHTERDAATSPRPARNVGEPEPVIATAPPTPRRARKPLEAFAVLRQALQTIAAPFGIVLKLLSKPLDMVPPKARDIVDWVALSLIVWVPIVWIFALLIV